MNTHVLLLKVTEEDLIKMLDQIGGDSDPINAKKKVVIQRRKYDFDDDDNDDNDDDLM